MTEQTHFETAIQILERQDLNYRKLVFAIAALSPETLVQAVERHDREADREGIDRECRDLVNRGRRQDAVKLLVGRLNLSYAAAVAALEKIRFNTSVSEEE